jgi:hypothetical protein
MADIGKVAVKFSADPSGLVAGVNAAVTSLKRLESSAAATSRGVGAIVALKGIEIVGSVFAKMGSAAYGLGQSLRAMAEEQSRVVESQLVMAKRVGMTFTELSGLAYAAELANVSIDTVVASSNRADVALSKLAAGSKGSVEAFKRLGLASADFAGKSSSERFQLIAAAIAKLPTSMERSAAAMGIFGRGGAALLPLFSEGADYIANMTREAKALGLTLNNSQAQSVDDMRDAFERANLAVSGVVRQVVANLSPAIKGIVDQFTRFIITAEGAKIGAQIGEGILNGARVLADYADQFVKYVGGVWNNAAQVSAQWADAWDMASRVAGLFEMAAGAMKVVVAALLHAGGELYLRFGMIVEAIKMGARILTGTSVKDAYAKMRENMAPVEAFNASLKKSADDAIAQFNSGFSRTFADKAVISQVAGPFRQALEKGISEASRNARVADEATKERPREWADAAKSAAQVLADNLEARLKQVKGLDSRSQEGLDAFFKWQRGDTGNEDVQKEQLGALNRIAAAVESPDDAVMVDMGGR